MSNNLIKTKNNNLQNQLNEWIEICQEINLLELNSNERNNKIKEFCIKFVPRDITIEECNEYANNIAGDEEFFQSIYRELNQCCSGNGVESITGNQKNKAIFTLLPLQDTAGLDIVREIAFIGYERGSVWRAAG